MRHLAILLIAPLLILWLISLREVRLKIGDYYYEQGNFDQAVNWYERVVRIEKLNLCQHKGDPYKCQQDLLKLKSPITRVTEGKLLIVSQLFGFEQVNALDAMDTMTQLTQRCNKPNKLRENTWT
jgi:hypothetical protein